MEIELNRLINHFAKTPFQVWGVYHYKIKPGTEGTEQGAPFPGIIFPLSGQAEYHFDGIPYLATPGNVILGGANMKLDKRVVGSEPWEYICVLYQVYGKEEDFSLTKFQTKITIGNSVKLNALLRKISSLSLSPGGMPALQRETVFRSALEEMFICARNQSGQGVKALFEKVTAFIHGHYMEELSVQDLAALYDSNENQLYYVFKKYCGMGVQNYLTDYRLNRAREMLVTTDAPVKEIAAVVGYSDPLYFSRSFHKRFGHSPTSARNIQE